MQDEFVSTNINILFLINQFFHLRKRTNKRTYKEREDAQKLKPADWNFTSSFFLSQVDSLHCYPCASRCLGWEGPVAKAAHTYKLSCLVLSQSWEGGREIKETEIDAKREGWGRGDRGEISSSMQESRSWEQAQTSAAHSELWTESYLPVGHLQADFKSHRLTETHSKVSNNTPEISLGNRPVESSKSLTVTCCVMWWQRRATAAEVKRVTPGVILVIKVQVSTHSVPGWSCWNWKRCRSEIWQEEHPVWE